MINWKDQIYNLIQNAGYSVCSMSSLPDSKTAHTTAPIGFYGSISAPTWKALYFKIEEQLGE